MYHATLTVSLLGSISRAKAALVQAQSNKDLTLLCINTKMRNDDLYFQNSKA